MRTKKSKQLVREELKKILYKRMLTENTNPFKKGDSVVVVKVFGTTHAKQSDARRFTGKKGIVNDVQGDYVFVNLKGFRSPSIEFHKNEIDWTDAINENEIPHQEEVDKFFSDTQNEMHYLNQKPVDGQKGSRTHREIEPWDEYDLSNWNALVRKSKKINERIEGSFVITDKTKPGTYLQTYKKDGAGSSWTRDIKNAMVFGTHGSASSVIGDQVDKWQSRWRVEDLNKVNESQFKKGQTVSYIVPGTSNEMKTGKITGFESTRDEDFAVIDGKTIPFSHLSELVNEDHPDHTHGLTIKGRGFDWKTPKYKRGDKLKIKLKNGKEFNLTFDSYSRQEGVAFGKFDGDRKPFQLDAIVESFNSKVDMEKVGEKLKRLKKDNPGKRISYDFISGGVIYKIDGKIVDESLNEDEDVVIYNGEEHEVMRRVDDKLGKRVYIRRKAPSAKLGKLDTFWVKPEDIEEGTCGYSKDGKPKSKPAGPHLITKSDLKEKIVNMIKKYQ